MTGKIVYMDRSDVKPGTAADLRTAVANLVRFVEAHEPRIMTYGFYIDDDALTMTLVAVHPDAASLEFHLDIGGPEFRKVGAFITLRTIEVFGEPSEHALDQLHAKARMLGDAAVVVHAPAAGFAR
jgi:hypothetical protein